MKLIPQKVLDRKQDFLSLVKVLEDGCWEWQGYIHPRGYGYFSRGYRAHRVSYAMFTGDDPTDLYICHRCDFTRCVNPAHLFAGTPLDNMRDMKDKGRDKNNPGGWEANYITMTPEKLEAMKSYYLGDLSLSTRDVARKFDMEAKHCWFWLKKAGVEIRGKRKKLTFSTEDMEKYKSMYESGSRITDIAILMGVEKHSASKRLKAFGVKIRDKNDRIIRTYRGQVVNKPEI